MSARWHRANWRSPNSSQQNIATSPSRGSCDPRAQYAGHIWQVGEIAFLKSHEIFNRDQTDALITPKYLERGATGHPVIVLKMSPSNTHAAITTVSSYHAENDNVKPTPPWSQAYHYSRKGSKDFRAFEGTELPPAGKNRPALQLEEGKFMPKKNASWVYVRSMWVVPVTVLGYFDKTPEILRLAEPARADLLANMEECSANAYKKVMDAVNLEYIPVNPKNLPANDPRVTSRPRRQYRPARGSPAPLRWPGQDQPSATSMTQPASARSLASLSWREQGQPSAIDRPQPAPASLPWRERKQLSAAPASADKPAAYPPQTRQRTWADVAAAGSSQSSRSEDWREKGPRAGHRGWRN